MSHQSFFLNVNVIDSNFTVRSISLPNNFTESSFQNYENKANNDYILIMSDSPDNENICPFLKGINMLDRIKSFRNRFEKQVSLPENCTILQFFLKDDNYIEKLNYKKDSITLCMFKNFIFLFGTILNKKNLLDTIQNSIQNRKIHPIYFPLLLEEVILDRMDQYLTNWLNYISFSDITKPEVENYKKKMVKRFKMERKIMLLCR